MISPMKITPYPPETVISHREEIMSYCTYASFLPQLVQVYRGKATGRDVVLAQGTNWAPELLQVFTCPPSPISVSCQNGAIIYAGGVVG